MPPSNYKSMPPSNYKSRRSQQGGAIEVHAEHRDLPKPAYQLTTVDIPPMRAPVSYPTDWERGQLLNVRNVGSEYGPHYQVTLLEEAPNPDRPERTLHFNDSMECQTFVSFWYAGGGANPLGLR